MKRRAQYSVPGCDRIGIVQKPRTRKGGGSENYAEDVWVHGGDVH